MYTYRIVLDAYNTRDMSARSARVLTYSQGHNRQEALRRIGAVYIGRDGSVSDGIHPWPGSPATGPIQARYLPEWEVVSIRAVKASGTARILAE